MTGRLLFLHQDGTTLNNPLFENIYQQQKYIANLSLIINLSTKSSFGNLD
jgi:hypothetical protein